MRRATWGVALILAGLVAGCGPPSLRQTGFPVSDRRARLERRARDGERAVPDLAAALEEDNPLVRRQAARLLLEIGEPAKDALLPALDNEDLLVRRTAIKMAAKLPPDEALQYLAKGVRDGSPLVRHAAVGSLATMEPRSEEVLALLRIASKDEVESIRAMAQKALWPFYKKVTSVRDQSTLDKDVQVVQTIRLPKDGWRFHLDPERNGHEKKWFEPAFDDSAWKAIAIEQAWQKAGYQYIGVAWYRRSIDLPARPDHLAVELHFKGVDECAWVWVNGRYVGQHDVGPSGWDQAFTLDVTQELVWGKRNQITVRAMNTAHAGGIWKPVLIEVLK